MKTLKHKTLAAAVVGVLFSNVAHSAETLELGNGVTLDWKGALAYSAAVRLEDAAPELKSSGNDNFEKHDFIGNGVFLLLESHLRWGNSGIVLSGSTFYDNVYQDDKFSDAVQKYHGGYTRLLDFYAYTTFSFGEAGYADFRAGRHVVAWGEGLFFPSISLAQGPSDGIKSSVPGTEVKDILLSEDQVSMQLELTPDWSVMAQWQFNWQETIVPEPGSFLSGSEAVGNGAYCLVPLPDGSCGYAPRGPDILPDETSQWGIGTRYRITEVTELGFYYLNYNDRIPMVEISPMANQFLGEYQVHYFDDIALYGATMSTTTGMASVAAEVSYKDGAPALVNTQFFGSPLALPSRAEILQSNLNAVINFGRTSFSDSVNLTVEAAYVDIMDVEARGVSGVPGSETDELYYTSYGFAVAASLSLSYPGLTENWDLNIPFGYSQQLSGRTITGGAGGEGDYRARLGADFTHHRTGLQLGLSYVRYMGNPDVDEPYEERTLSDRDNIAFTAKWAF